MTSDAVTAKPASSDDRSMRINYRALIEIVLFIAIGLGIDYLFFGGTRFRNVVPHPFWLIVLLISVQYGVTEGLTAALACSLALWVGNLPPQTLDQDVYGYWLKIVVNPASWFGAAIVFGELRARDKRRIDTQATELKAALDREAVLSEAYESVSQARRELEARVAGQLKTVYAIYQAARAIEQLGPNEVLGGITDLVRTILSARKFSVYLLKSGTLEAVITEGWESGDRFQRVYSDSSALYQAVIGGQQSLCVARPRDRDVLAGEGMLAGPLLDGAHEVIGMLKVEGLGFLDLNLSTMENFRVVCDWIGNAFAKATRFEEATAASLYASDKLLLSASFLERQTAFLTSLGHRVGFDLSMLMVVVAGVADADPAEKRRWAHEVGQVVAEQLRNTDMAFDYQRSGFEFAVLLPATSSTEAQIVADKIRRSIALRLGSTAAEQAKITITVRALVQGVARK